MVGLYIGCTTVFIFLYLLVYIDYIKTVQQTKYVDWDVKTITAGDYTVEFNFTLKQYEHWKEHYHHKLNILSECSQFKQYVQNELEKRCFEVENQGYEEEKEEKMEIKIA
jgi:hypothetical protein